jgi:cation:H+ antiporter
MFIRGSAALCLIALLVVEAKPIPAAHPASILWTAPAILLASMMIAWGAESAQFFMAQGFALAILAWLQTMPEFAVEAVLAWHQQTSYLLANLTGALRLLTGLGWPMIYGTAAVAHRIRDKKPLRAITLEPAHGFQVIGLLACLAYVAVIWWKGSLNLLDAAVLIAIYAVYLLVLRRAPAAKHEDIEDLELIPRSVVKARKPVRVASIAALFIGGGALIYFLAAPFLASLFALSGVAGVSSFVFIQWVAPFVSEFPEKVSAFYWARTIEKASMALMNMVSSNINQWTLLTAMLPIVYSMSRWAPSAIVFDPTQNVEFLMTIGQSLLGAMFLMNMELRWWEAAGLFALWLIQFVFSIGSTGTHIHWAITIAYFAWATLEILRMALGPRRATALTHFAEMWKGLKRAGR